MFVVSIVSSWGCRGYSAEYGAKVSQFLLTAILQVYNVATSCEVLEGRLKQGGASSDGNGLRALFAPPHMSSRHRTMEPLGRWHATIYSRPFIYISMMLSYFFHTFNRIALWQTSNKKSQFISWTVYFAWGMCPPKVRFKDERPLLDWIGNQPTSCMLTLICRPRKTLLEALAAIIGISEPRFYLFVPNFAYFL